MNPDLEKLIEMAAKGEAVTDRQREIIRNKAVSLGEDPDEAELILDLTVKGNKKKEVGKTGGDYVLEDDVEDKFMDDMSQRLLNQIHSDKRIKEESVQTKALYRKTEGKILCGVCAGIADKYNISALVVRLIFFFTYAISLWVYIVMAITLPKDN